MFYHAQRSHLVQSVSYLLTIHVCLLNLLLSSIVFAMSILLIRISSRPACCLLLPGYLLSIG